MNKEELLKMASRAGFFVPQGGDSILSPYEEDVDINDIVETFANAILERAAVELEECEKEEPESMNWDNGAPSKIIRALKG